MILSLSLFSICAHQQGMNPELFSIFDYSHFRTVIIPGTWYTSFQIGQLAVSVDKVDNVLIQEP